MHPNVDCWRSDFGHFTSFLVFVPCYFFFFVAFGGVYRFVFLFSLLFFVCLFVCFWATSPHLALLLFLDYCCCCLV